MIINPRLGGKNFSDAESGTFTGTRSPTSWRPTPVRRLPSFGGSAFALAHDLAPRLNRTHGAQGLAQVNHPSQPNLRRGDEEVVCHRSQGRILSSRHASLAPRKPVFRAPTFDHWLSALLFSTHKVLASGFSGEARLPTFPRDEFEGTTCHSSTHKGGREWAGKKAVVVGCCNSGHDIAQDFYQEGADTTIVQRSSTCTFLHPLFFTLSQP